jgi:hypothetical protein
MSTVNLSPFAGAGAQFFDSNGVPLSGGLIYTYAAGTTTPQATYTTSTGNIANSNPIVLGSDGRTPQEIWLVNASSYKFILQNSSGTQIGSYDNILGVNDTTSLIAFENTLIGSTGSSLVGYNQGSSNATTRTVQSKLQEFVSVKDFGAVGDNSHDDTNAIQSALNYAAPLGYVVIFPPGQYKITSGLTAGFSSGGIFMEGVGYGSGNTNDNGIFPTGSGYTALTVGGNVNVFSICLGGGGNTINGLYLNNISLSLINKIRVYNFNGFGVRIDKVYDTVFEVISSELCGNTSSTTLNTYSYPNYAFGMFDAGDTCNMSHILRLQVEQAQYYAIYVSGNTLSCLIDNIHSERATTSASYQSLPTWQLSGNRCRYNVARLESNQPSTATASISGGNTTFANLLIEGAIVVSASGTNGSSITIETPEIQGTLQAQSNQIGTITLIGGSVSNLNSQSLGWKIFSTNIGTLTIDYSGSSDPKAFEVFGAVISTLASGSTNSSATFNDCNIGNLAATSGVYGLQGTSIYNNCSITCSSTYNIGYSANYFNSCIINANVTLNPGSIYLSNTVINGTLTQSSGSISSIFDDSSYATGTVSGFGAPTGNAWNKGQRTFNLAPASGSPKSWVCTVSGTPGTWVSEGNL